MRRSLEVAACVDKKALLAEAAHSTVLRYCVNGLHIEAQVDDPQLAVALNGLLGRHVVGGNGSPPTERSLICTLEATNGLPPIVPYEAVPLFDDSGLRCSALEGLLFLEVDHLAVALADLQALRITAFVDRSKLHATWSIQHFVVLPLVLEFLRLRGLYAIHAAALERDGFALILPALPGSGKSTLAIALVRAGLRLLSDDMPFLTANHGSAEVVAFPEDINVCPDSIPFFEELAFLSRGSLNERNKYSFPIDHLFPNSLAERGSPRLIVFPQITRTASSILQPLSRAAAFTALLQHSLRPLNRMLYGAHFGTVLDTVASCDCYQFQVGRDPGEAAGQLVDLLTGSGESR